MDIIASCLSAVNDNTLGSDNSTKKPITLINNSSYRYKHHHKNTSSYKYPEIYFLNLINSNQIWIVMNSFR